MITRRDFLKITVAGGALASLNNLEEAKATIYQVVPDTEFCYEGQRKIPIIAKTSIIVVGGSSRAIATAVAAAKTGCDVFLIGYMPYLGDDICGSFLFEHNKDEKLQTDLSRKIFPGKEYPTPLSVKTVLENELIDNNLANPDLDVSYLMKKMTMSRASLYNKVKALTGMGVNDYINKIRIEKASLMLIQTDLTISEISYEVGFTYQRYFSTIFKQVKGMTPTQFKEENRRKES